MLSRRALIGSGSALLGAAGCAVAAEASDGPVGESLPRIEERIRELMARYRIPGLGVAARLDGKTVLAAGYGTAAIPFNAPATRSTLFHAGSVGKHVTAAGVLQLVEAGQVELGRGIGDYVDGLPSSWRAGRFATC